MSVFQRYADVYDALYQDKDYRAEADWVAQSLRSRVSSLQSVLELGCGSGRHAIEWAATGVSVHGVDRSAPMVAQARERQERMVTGADKCFFEEGDVRRLDLNKTFDSVVSLFHVMSYMETEEDACGLLTTARKHLNPGGVFLFDAWHGPGVLSDPPVVRVKRVSTPSVQILRLAEPTMETVSDRVRIMYTLFTTHQPAQGWQQFQETHVMRYLFPRRVSAWAERCGFSSTEVVAWMREGVPGDRDWTAVYVARV